MENHQDLNFKQFEVICRTCLIRLTPVIEHISIFDATNENKLEVLRTYVSIKAEENDGLPQNICLNCVKDLDHVRSFIKKSQEADNCLRAILLKNADNETKKPLENAQNKPTNYTKTVNANRRHKNMTIKLDISTADVPDQVSTKRARINRIQVAGPPYTCYPCNKSYAKIGEFRQHRREFKHPRPRNFRCTLCPKAFPSNDNLVRHIRSHTKEKPFQCDICSASFSIDANLKRHQMIHTGERPHICDACGKGFIQADGLMKHRRTHTGEKPFVCSYCGKSYKHLDQHKLHIKRHHSSDDPSSNINKPREHECGTCKRVFVSKATLKIHQLSHGEKKFLCSDCGRGFFMKVALQNHYRVHSGEKPYRCDICNKAFAQFCSLKVHKFTHTGEKPYKCKVCSKAFTQYPHLKYHIRTHSGEKPYVCSYCNKGFALKNNMIVHTRIHTGETPYICPVCGKGFYDSSNMKKHCKGHGQHDFICESGQ